MTRPVVPDNNGDVMSATVKVAYDGPALREGAMDVRDLAPALLAIGDLIDESYRLLTGDKKGLSVKVRSDFERGSFGIHIDVVAIWPQLRQLFSGPDGSALANILTLLGFVGVPSGAISLIKMVKRLRGKKPLAAVYSPEGRTVTVEIDGDKFVVSEETVRLYADVRVRNSLSKALAPLLKEGIDTFESRGDDKVVIERVTSDEVGSFAPPAAIAVEETTPLIDTTSERAFTVVAPSFRDGNKWRVSDGGSDVHIAIEDRAFLDKVEAHEIVFGKGDVLLCTVRTVQKQTPDGLHIEHHALAVKHTPAPRQLAMRLPVPPKP